MKPLISCIAVFCSLPLFCVAAEQEGNSITQAPPSIEDLENQDLSRAIEGVFDDVERQSKEVSKQTHSDCLKAFGERGFCECLEENLPPIKFSEYVEIVTTPKQELKHSKTENLVRKTRKARDICVKSFK